MCPVLKRKIFGPAPTPEKLTDGFPKEMTFRPSQIRSSAADSALMIPDAFAARDHYSDLKMPVVIVAGEEDRIVDIDNRSGRLHGAMSQGVFHRVPGAGHMIHQTGTETVMACVDKAARPGDEPGNVVPFAA